MHRGHDAYRSAELGDTALPVTRVQLARWSHAIVWVAFVSAPATYALAGSRLEDTSVRFAATPPWTPAAIVLFSTSH
jgi:hypothetical protein